MATSFETTVLVSLAKIESALDQNDLDHIVIKANVNKIPAIEIGLNNHLTAHNNLRNYIYYPVTGAAIIGLMGAFAKLVLHLF